jgi:hypothetical protein
MMAMIATGIVVNVPVPAQGIPVVQRALEALLPRLKQLRAVGSNLVDMEDTVRGTPELGALHEMLSERYDFADAMDQARIIAMILVNMTCPDDAQKVRSVLRAAAQFAVKETDIDITQVNRNLTQLATPTMQAQATKIRDLIIEMQDILKPFTGKE